MAVGQINGVVGLTGFSDEKMTGRLVGTKKSGRKVGFHCNTNVGQLVSIRYSNIGKCISNIGIKLVNHCNIFSMSLVSLMSSPTLVNGCIFQYWYIIYESPTMKYMLPTLVYHIFQQWKYEN